MSGLEKNEPTVSPSIRVRTGRDLCHFFINRGKIQYLRDSTHKLSGQIVEIPEFDEIGNSSGSEMLNSE